MIEICAVMHEASLENRLHIVMGCECATGATHEGGSKMSHESSWKQGVSDAQKGVKPQNMNNASWQNRQGYIAGYKSVK